MSKTAHSSSSSSSISTATISGPVITETKGQTAATGSGGGAGIAEQLPKIMKQIFLVKAPAGELDGSELELKEVAVPELKSGQFLVRVHYYAVDPYIRLYCMSPAHVGKVLTGGIVGTIVATTTEEWPVGTVVSGDLGAVDYGVTDGAGFRKVDPSLGPISTAVSILGMPGCTAWFGLREGISFPKGGTVVVSGAAGAVGNAFGQLAKRAGAGIVVGIAGTAAKCAMLLKRGFDVAINYKTDNVPEALATACPDGVDAYFDNVGGTIARAVLQNMKPGGSVCKCGHISDYNLSAEQKTAAAAQHADEEKVIQAKSLVVKPFMVYNYKSQWPTAIADMAAAIKSGALQYDETIVDGLENVPRALQSVFKGANTGKQLVRLVS